MARSASFVRLVCIPSPLFNGESLNFCRRAIQAKHVARSASFFRLCCILSPLIIEKHLTVNATGEISINGAPNCGIGTELFKGAIIVRGYGIAILLPYCTILNSFQLTASE